MNLNRTLWLPALLGWLAVTCALEHPGAQAPWSPPPSCSISDWDPGPGAQVGWAAAGRAWPLNPGERELGQVPGVGRKRARRLAQALLAAAVDPRSVGSGAWMEGLAGIGPVTAGAVRSWFLARYPPSRAVCLWEPNSACTARWIGSLLSFGASAACEPWHNPHREAVHFEAATWPTPFKSP